jgi:hypothetical protein
MLRAGVIHHFDVTLAFVTPKSSSLQALMSPGGVRQMHGHSTPMQGQAAPSWQDGPTSGSYSYVSTVLGACREEGKKVYLVITAGRCLLIIAQQVMPLWPLYFHLISWTELGHRSRKWLSGAPGIDGYSIAFACTLDLRRFIG